MTKNKLLPYNPRLKALARELRKAGVLSEVLLWKKIKNKSYGVEFHRQVPIDEYIIDFYCHELSLAIEIDGKSHQFEEVAKRDEVRQKRLEDLGVRFLRFSDKEIKRNLETISFCLANYIEDLKKEAGIE
jgi:very-short-patch-repair endonuclease